MAFHGRHEGRSLRRGFVKFQSLFGGPWLMARTTFAALSGIGSGITRVVGRPRGRLFLDMLSAYI